MVPLDPTPEPAPAAVARPLAAEQAAADAGPPRLHLVVVTTRPLRPAETTGPARLRTRFWHPRDHRWSENDFESLEHARRLFLDESGWTLRQEQTLDDILACEWIFEARRADFAQATAEEILEEVGLDRAVVDRLLEEGGSGHRSRAGPHAT